MYRVFPCSLAAAALVLFVPHAHADIFDWMWGAEQAPELASEVPGLCDSYADDAVSAAAANERLACGRGGPRYSTDRNVHYWWCMGSRASSVRAEDTNRSAEMDKCNYCRGYAIRVAEKLREARLYSCDVTGAKWAPDPQDHFRWCFGSADSLDVAPSEDRGRDIDVALCKDGYNTAQLAACEAYADKAVEQAKGNAKLRCGDTGPQWTQDRDVHFAFCTSSTKTNPNNAGNVIANEQGARDKRNNFCALAATRRKNLPTTATTKQLRSGVSGKSGASTARGAGKAATKPVATARRPSGSSAVDAVKPAGTAAKKQSPSGGSSAMDRLSGDSQLPSSSRSPDGTRAAGGRSGGGGAGGATSSGSSSAGTGGAPGIVTSPSTAPIRTAPTGDPLRLR